MFFVGTQASISLTSILCFFSFKFDNSGGPGECQSFNENTLVG